MQKQCRICKSTWPAMTTLEAFQNYLRIKRFHPGKECTYDERK